MAPLAYKRLHTFSRMPNRSQISLYTIIVLANLCFYLCVMQLFYQEVERQIFLSVFTILSALMIFGGIATGQIDPTDQVMTKFMEDKKNFNQFLLQNQKRIDITDIRQCIICDAKCKKSSLHCSDCKRCIEGRDHHCDYLNICIGCRNYKMFFITVCLTWGFLTMYIVSMTFVTYKINSIEEQLRTSAQFIIEWIAACAVIITWVPITALLIFHCYLIKNNITTIQFIKKDKNIGRNLNKKSKNQTKIQQEKQKKNKQQIQNNKIPFKIPQSIQEQPTNTIIINSNQTPSIIKNTFQQTGKQNQDTIKFNRTVKDQQKKNSKFQSSFSSKISEKLVENQSDKVKKNQQVIIQEKDAVKVQIHQFIEDEPSKQHKDQKQGSLKTQNDIIIVYQDGEKIKSQQMIKTSQKILRSCAFRYMIGSNILEYKTADQMKQNQNMDQAGIEEINFQPQKKGPEQFFNTTKISKRTNISRQDSQTQSNKSNQIPIK